MRPESSRNWSISQCGNDTVRGDERMDSQEELFHIDIAIRNKNRLPALHCIDWEIAIAIKDMIATLFESLDRNTRRDRRMFERI